MKCKVCSREVKDEGFCMLHLKAYKNICEKTGLRPLTQRRVSDILAEQDMLGIINAKIISKGRFGRTREMSLAVPSSLKPKIKKILEESLDLVK